MKRKWWLAALLASSLAVAGMAYLPAVPARAGAHSLVGADARQSAGYVCPLTGDELPCPDCCPLDGGK